MHIKYCTKIVQNISKPYITKDGTWSFTCVATKSVFLNFTTVVPPRGLNISYLRFFKLYNCIAIKKKRLNKCEFNRINLFVLLTSLSIWFQSRSECNNRFHCPKCLDLRRLPSRTVADVVWPLVSLFLAKRLHNRSQWSEGCPECLWCDRRPIVWPI